MQSREHTSWVNAIATDDQYLYTGSYDGHVIVWEMVFFNLNYYFNLNKETFTLVRKMTLESRINCIVTGNNRVFTGEANGSVSLWNKVRIFQEFSENYLKGGELIKMIQDHTDSVTGISVTEYNLYTASYDKTVRVYDNVKENSKKILIF